MPAGNIDCRELGKLLRRLRGTAPRKDLWKLCTPYGGYEVALEEGGLRVHKQSVGRLGGVWAGDEVAQYREVLRLALWS